MKRRYSYEEAMDGFASSGLSFLHCSYLFGRPIFGAENDSSAVWTILVVLAILIDGWMDGWMDGLFFSR
jgi:hypothetical protein